MAIKTLPHIIYNDVPRPNKPLPEISKLFVWDIALCQNSLQFIQNKYKVRFHLVNIEWNDALYRYLDFGGFNTIVICEKRLYRRYTAFVEEQCEVIESIWYYYNHLKVCYSNIYLEEKSNWELSCLKLDIFLIFYASKCSVEFYHSKRNVSKAKAGRRHQSVLYNSPLLLW